MKNLRYIPDLFRYRPVDKVDFDFDKQLIDFYQIYNSTLHDNWGNTIIENL